jgi:hypothetical protein
MTTRHGPGEEEYRHIGAHQQQDEHAGCQAEGDEEGHRASRVGLVNNRAIGDEQPVTWPGCRRSGDFAMMFSSACASPIVCPGARRPERLSHARRRGASRK